MANAIAVPVKLVTHVNVKLDGMDNIVNIVSVGVWVSHTGKLVTHVKVKLDGMDNVVNIVSVGVWSEVCG